MHRPLLFLFFCLIAVWAQGQNNVQTLQQELAEAQSPVEKMNLQFEIGKLQLQQNDRDAAEKSLRAAYELAKTLNNKSMDAQASYLLYDANRGNRSSQSFWLNRTLDLAKQIGDSDLIVKATIARSRMFTSQGNYQQAFYVMEEAFDYFSNKGTSISELEQKFAMEQRRLQRERNLMEQQRNELAAQRDTLSTEILSLRSEKNQLSSDNENLQEQTELLSQEKRAVEEEVNQKTQELSSVAKEKAMIERVADQRTAEVKQLSRDTLEKQLIIQEARNQLMQSQLDLQRRNQIIVGAVIGLLSLLVISLLLYSRFKTKKRAAKLLAAKNEEIQREQERSDELLRNILPAQIAEELKSTGKAKARQFPEVTVFFSDFHNFTKDAESLGPEKLVAELDTIFRQFDHIIGQYPDIEKIKTIGDAYMCATGFSDRAGFPNNMVKAALEMQAYLAEKAKTEPRLSRARMGMHTGDVTAGVVGSKKFAYDIWGDTVNIAARMESKSEAGRVNISEATYRKIHYKFHCTPRGKIQAKNKGMIEMYYVDGEKAF
jgi:class 3 adenylate cyclase